MPIFNEVIDADGNKSYVEVEITDVLTDDVVKQTEAYKEIFSESVSRRQLITDLKGKISKLATIETDDEQGSEAEDEGSNTDTTNSSEVVSPPAPLDEEALLQKLLDLQAQRQADADKAVSEYQKMVNAVAKENGVPSSVLRGSTQEELDAHAKQMIKEKLVFPTVSANGTTGDDGKTNLETMMDSIYEKNGLGERN